ncbi:fluoride efflux transporter CrcB [Polaribacter ponticola]|uniref:Fluoride-specific ion channel FluC n=1 Tax=Polaribacter ponticola TaxID=2978475 RepID=A0ABT5S5V5_9FLAO|nr:fluoride efflux transporter CrcB [Polaribacter sp. MSW5]MDD7913473.1 fluoride efflux transporter CrcB [Polaribacter sp. MSW5]
MKNLLFVFIGGGFGSVLRFLIGKWLNNSEGNFPLGTFVANVLGSLLIGVILGYVAKNDAINQNHTLLLATGFCGGFTTFSTFAYENQVFLKSGDFTSFAFYTIASFVVGFLAVFAGIYLVKFI